MIYVITIDHNNAAPSVFLGIDHRKSEETHDFTPDQRPLRTQLNLPPGRF